jgi:uncharacterized membrane protein
MVPRPTFLILALLLAACAGDRPAQTLPAKRRATGHSSASTSSAPLLVRGIVKLTPSLLFQSCEAGPLMNVLDSTGDRIVSTYRFMQATEQDGMYVLARGGATAQGQMVFRELEFAGRPDAGTGCGEAALDYLVMVRGTDPQWSLKLTGSTLQFSGAGESAPIEFPAPAPDDSGGFKRYQTISDNGAHTLHLLLIRSSCSEGRTGMYSAISAAAVLDGKRLQGCGWRGRLP